MVDQSYFVPLLGAAGEALDYKKANDIEKNLAFLIRQWPAFEAEGTAELVGSFGYLQAGERASPAQGTRVTLLQHLPRLEVWFEGPGAETLQWAGEGWEAAPGGGTAPGRLALERTLDEPSEQAAMEALEALKVGCGGQADAAVSLAARRADGTVRIAREGLTRMLFRPGGTWGLAQAWAGRWRGLEGSDWDRIRTLKKEEVV